MRVLLIEGHSRSAAVLSADLKADAVQVGIAESGDDALFMMRVYEFGLVLLNLVLPDMDSNLLISRIRAAKHATPIIALSANQQARLKALAAGADDVVERDIDRAKLMARICAIVRRSHGFSRTAHGHQHRLGTRLFRQG